MCTSTVTHLDSPDNQPSPTTTTTTTITTTVTTTTTTNTVEKDRSDDDTLQHAFKMRNENLKPATPSATDSSHYPGATNGLRRRPIDPTKIRLQPSTIVNSSFLSTQFNYFQEDEIQKIERILITVMTITDICRICWVRNEVSHPHSTYYCPTQVCSGSS